MSHILLFEPGMGGHRLGWMRIIAEEFRQNRGCLSSDARLTIAAPNAILESLRGSIGAVESEGLALLSLGAEVRDAARGLRETLSLVQPETLLFLELTLWERFLAQQRLPCAVAGILFVQYPEIDPSKGPLPRRVEKFLRKKWKEWLTGLWLRRQKWRGVFLLNGERACAALNGRFAAMPVFIPVPDPVGRRGRRAEGTGRMAEGVRASPAGARSSPTKDRGVGRAGEEEHRGQRSVRFLHVGVLSARKGLEVGFRAIERVSAEWTERCEVVIIGTIEDPYRARFERALDRLRVRRPDARVIWEERPLSDEEFEAAIRSADWIWMPYLRSEYSSGILVHAAAAGAPVLGPDDGLLGRLIAEWSLGRVSAITPRALATALEEAARRPFEADEERRAAFVRKSSPAAFARRVLDACYSAGDGLAPGGREIRGGPI